MHRLISLTLRHPSAAMLRALTGLVHKIIMESIGICHMPRSATLAKSNGRYIVSGRCPLPRNGHTLSMDALQPIDVSVTKIRLNNMRAVVSRHIPRMLCNVHRRLLLNDIGRLLHLKRRHTVAISVLPIMRRRLVTRLKMRSIIKRLHTMTHHHRRLGPLYTVKEHVLRLNITEHSWRRRLRIRTIRPPQIRHR